jgi:hypothetical protein
MDTDTILITLLAMFVLTLGIGSYCQFLKHQIGNDKARDSEFDIKDDPWL